MGAGQKRGKVCPPRLGLCRLLQAESKARSVWQLDIGMCDTPARTPLPSLVPSPGGPVDTVITFLFEEASLEIKVPKLGSCYQLCLPCCSVCIYF